MLLACEQQQGWFFLIQGMEKDNPEDVINNYIFALHEGDYEVAYNYLSDSLPYYPKDVAAFRRSMKDEILDNHDFLVFETMIASKDRKNRKTTVQIKPFGST